MARRFFQHLILLLICFAAAPLAFAETQSCAFRKSGQSVFSGELRQANWADILALPESCPQVQQAIKEQRTNPYGFTWKACERKDLHGVTVPFAQNGDFKPECAPDVLYSWQPLDKIKALAMKAKHDHILPLQYMYFWRTPLSTFGYGDASVRVKLKPGTQFKQIAWNQRTCPLNAIEDKTTVYVSVLPPVAYSEYLLCSGEPVESWSYGTAEHLKEMKAEMIWIRENSSANYDRVARDGGNTQCSGNECLRFYRQSPLQKDFLKTSYAYALGLRIPDVNTDWTLEHLSSNLHLMQKLVQENSGPIFFAEGVANDPLRHFETQTPSYFNPVKSRAIQY